MTEEEGKEVGMPTQNLAHPYFRKRVRAAFLRESLVALCCASNPFTKTN